MIKRRELIILLREQADKYDMLRRHAHTATDHDLYAELERDCNRLAARFQEDIREVASKHTREDAAEGIL